MQSYIAAPSINKIDFFFINRLLNFKNFHNAEMLYLYLLFDLLRQVFQNSKPYYKVVLHKVFHEK